MSFSIDDHSLRFDFVVRSIRSRSSNDRERHSGDDEAHKERGAKFKGIICGTAGRRFAMAAAATSEELGGSPKC